MRKFFLAFALIIAVVTSSTSAKITVNFTNNTESKIDSVSVMKAPLLKYINSRIRTEQGVETFSVPVKGTKVVIPTDGNETEYVVLQFNDKSSLAMAIGPSENPVLNVNSLSPLNIGYSNTPTMEAMSEIIVITDPYYEKYRELNQAEVKDQAAIEAVIKECDQEIKDYIEEHINDTKSTYAITRLSGQDFVDTYDRLSERAKTSPYYPIAQKIYEQTKENLEKERKQKELQDGSHDAPNFTLNDLQGKPVSLSQFRGKWVIIDFWGSWCIWCIKGFPELKEAYAKYKGRLEVIGLDCNETEEAWKAGVEKYELPWVNVYCPKGNPVLSEFGVQGFPTKAIIDPQGKIRNITVGHNPEFFTVLDELMSK